jgi:hypothetical protein
MKVPFHKKMPTNKTFVPTPELPTLQEAQDAFQIELDKYNAEPDPTASTDAGDKGADNGNASFKITVIRLSAELKESTGKHTYRYVSGIPADMKDKVRMLGRDSRANTIITSASEYGVQNKEVTIDAFLSENTYEDSENFGMFEVRFARKTKDKEASADNNKKLRARRDHVRKTLALYKGEQFADFRKGLMKELARIVAQLPTVEQEMPDMPEEETA